ncbi:MAG: radical family heme chaperone HemW [Bacteroidota bacterium]
MAGIYLHIPFCRKACSYCDFHFSTSLQKADEMGEALLTEITLQRDYFEGRPTVETVYFGGGTPSLVPAAHLGRILDLIRETWSVAGDAEVTLEANPDDLSTRKLREFQAMGINRLSVGVQSFHDPDLLLLRRSHDAQQADRSIKAAQDAGFENITLDLIYGIPGSGMQQWRANVDQAIGLQVPHVSAYALTVEEKTLLHWQIAKGIVTPEPDQAHEAQYFHLIDRLGEAGILQYELSNFAREGFRSRHNGGYWKGVPYLGLGPSAHSFQDGVRAWNVANNAAYLRALAEGRLAVANTEQLSDRDQLNEHLMTQLRTVEGLDLKYLSDRWGLDLLQEEALMRWREAGIVVVDGGRLRLARQGWMVSDAVIRDLFRV